MGTHRHQSKSVHESSDDRDSVMRTSVLLHVDVNDGTKFQIQLTRVPGIGEEISREDRSYKVTRVLHEPIGDDGKARFGWHAFIVADLQPEDEEPPKRSKRAKKR